MADITPTRSIAIEIGEERRAMRDGLQFLDEKRLLLVAEILAALRRYDATAGAFREGFAMAAIALQGAIARHGLDGVQVYPAVPMGEARFRSTRRQLFGVRLFEAELQTAFEAVRAPERPSFEAENCRTCFAELLRLAAPLAALAGNLERLRVEYRRTERRARALEDVLLPELDSMMREIDARLEEIDQEEAVRVRIGVMRASRACGP